MRVRNSSCVTDERVPSDRAIASSCPFSSVERSADTGTPVDDKDYKVPFAFNGKIDKLTVFGGLDGVLKDVVRIRVPG